MGARRDGVEGSPLSAHSAYASPRLHVALLVSLAISAFVIATTHTPTGEYIGAMTDHLHHPRATWNFFARGFDVYRIPHKVICERVAYSYEGAFWPTYPVAYPPGMFVVFGLPAIYGRYTSASPADFGRAVVAYLVLVTHLATWSFAGLARRVGSAFWMAVAAFVWIYFVHLSLLGLYDGAWLLTGCFAMRAMSRKRHALATLWFVASALVSYRAASYAPLAAAAFFATLRGSDSPRTKVAVTIGALAGAAIVAACFWALSHYGPHEQDSAHSTLWPLRFQGWFLLSIGLGVAVAVGYGASLLVGASVAFSTFLAVLHAGHHWHGTVCIAPLFAMLLARRRPLWAQVAVALWLVFFLSSAFGYGPFDAFDELLRFATNGGG